MHIIEKICGGISSVFTALIKGIMTFSAVIGILLILLIIAIFL